MGLFKKITSKETRQKLDFFMSFHDPREGLRPVTKDDVIPLTLSFLLAFLTCIIAVCLYWLLRNVVSELPACLILICALTIGLRAFRRFLRKEKT